MRKPLSSKNWRVTGQTSAGERWASTQRLLPLRCRLKSLTSAVADSGCGRGTSNSPVARSSATLRGIGSSGSMRLTLLASGGSCIGAVGCACR